MPIWLWISKIEIDSVFSKSGPPTGERTDTGATGHHFKISNGSFCCQSLLLYCCFLQGNQRNRLHEQGAYGGHKLGSRHSGGISCPILCLIIPQMKGSFMACPKCVANKLPKRRVDSRRLRQLAQKLHNTPLGLLMVLQSFSATFSR